MRAPPTERERERERERAVLATDELKYFTDINYYLYGLDLVVGKTHTFFNSHIGCLTYSMYHQTETTMIKVITDETVLI